MPTTRGTDGTELYYETWGRVDGEPLLLVMGLGADMRAWLFQRIPLGRRFRCIALDNRGVGRSETPAGPYDLEQMARDAVSVLDAVGVESAHVLGVSMGGVIGQILGVGHPERVRSLVLSSTACRHHEWRRELLEEWEEAARTEGMGALGSEALRWLIHPRIRKRFGIWINLLARVVMSSPSEGFANQARAILDMSDDVRLELRSIEVPTLVLVGSQDILTPVGDAEELTELIPDARLHVITGATHGVNAEAPVTYNRAVIDFLDELTSTSASDAEHSPSRPAHEATA